MAATKTYYEKLRDPRWQKKRLAVLDAAGWRCEECGAEGRELHVHHGYYGKGLDPWDYSDKTLHTLCDNCHEIAEQLLAEIRERIGRLRFAGLSDLLSRLESLEGRVIVQDLPRPTLKTVMDSVPDALREAIDSGELTDDEEIEFLQQVIRQERVRQGIPVDGGVS